MKEKKGNVGKGKILLSSVMVVAVVMLLCGGAYHLLVAFPYEGPNAGERTAVVIALMAVLAGVLTYAFELREYKRIYAERLSFAKERARFELVYENTTINIWDLDYAKREITQTPRSSEYHGFGKVISNVPESLVETGYVHQDSAAEMLDMYENLFAGAPRVEGVFRVQNTGRTGYWYEHICYSAVYDNEGRACGAIGMSEDVSEQYEKNAAWQQLVDSMSEVKGENSYVCEYDLTGDKFVRQQGDLFKYLDFDREDSFSEYVLTCTRQVVHRDDIEGAMRLLNRDNLLAAFYDGRTEEELNYRARTDRGYLWTNMNVKLYKNLSDNSIHVIMAHTDINERKVAELKLLHQSQKDALTGALNRKVFEQQLNKITTEMPDTGHALIMIDMDNFKRVNDTFGHLIGDKVLVDTVNGLKSLLRAGDLIGRVGGDEFMVFFRNVPNPNVIRRRARLILHMMHDDLGSGVKTSGSIGIALYPKDGTTFEQLYKCADIAVYNAKEQGRDQLCFFSEELVGYSSGETSPIDVPFMCRADEAERENLINDLLEENQRLMHLVEENERYRQIVEKNGLSASADKSQGRSCTGRPTANSPGICETRTAGEV